MDEDEIKTGERIDRIFLSKVKEVDSKKHTVDVIMSDASVDRYNEIIAPKAWGKMTTYKKHPVLLSSHNYHGLKNQIGKSEKIAVNPQGQLESKMKYYVNKGNEEADWGFFLAEEGIAAYSVGFIPKAYVYRGSEEFEVEAKELGLTKKARESVRIIFTEVELLENSQVLVPANANGLQKSFESEEIQGDAVLKGLYSEIIENIDKFKEFFDTDGAAAISKSFEEDDEKKGPTGRVRRKKGLGGLLADMKGVIGGDDKKEIDAEEKDLNEPTGDAEGKDIDGGEDDRDGIDTDTSEKDLDADESEGKDLDSSEKDADIATVEGKDVEGAGEEIDDIADSDLELKKVVPFKSFGLMTEGTPWSAVKARRALRTFASDSDKDKIDYSTYALGFTFSDESDSVNFKGSLLHHTVSDGEIKTVWRGVAAAMAVLLGAMDGVDVSETERKGMYDHLSKHYKEFDKEVPAFKAYADVNEVLAEVKDSETAMTLCKELSGIKSVDPVPTLDDIEDTIEKGVGKITSLLKEVDDTFAALKQAADQISKFESELSALKSVVSDLEENTLDGKEAKEKAEGQIGTLLKGIKEITQKKAAI